MLQVVVLSGASLSFGASAAASTFTSMRSFKVSLSIWANCFGVSSRYSISSVRLSFSIWSGAIVFLTRELFVWPRATGRASRATNRKIRKTITIAESETMKMNFSTIHSSGRARWPRFKPIQPTLRLSCLAICSEC